MWNCCTHNIKGKASEENRTECFIHCCEYQSSISVWLSATQLFPNAEKVMPVSTMYKSHNLASKQWYLEKCLNEQSPKDMGHDLNRHDYKWT